MMKEDSLFTWKMFCVKRGFLFFCRKLCCCETKNALPVRNDVFMK